MTLNYKYHKPDIIGSNLRDIYPMKDKGKWSCFVFGILYFTRLMSEEEPS